MSEVPCKHCTRRQLGCHSSCDDYKAFREEIEYGHHQRTLYSTPFTRTYEKVLHRKAIIKRGKGKL